MQINKFTLAAVAAVASIVAVPVLAQIAGAQSVSSSTSSRPVPTQACIQAMAGLEDATLSGFDAQSSAKKAALQAYSDALKAAAGITDDTQRLAALKKAENDFKTAMKNAEQLDSAAMKTAKDAVKAACGNAGKKGFGGKMDSEGSERKGKGSENRDSYSKKPVNRGYGKHDKGPNGSLSSVSSSQ